MARTSLSILAVSNVKEGSDHNFDITPLVSCACMFKNDLNMGESFHGLFLKFFSFSLSKGILPLNLEFLIFLRHRASFKF